MFSKFIGWLLGWCGLSFWPMSPRRLEGSSVEKGELGCPWNIIWDNELFSLKDEYDVSSVGGQFFERRVEVRGVWLKVLAVKSGSLTGFAVDFVVTNDKGEDVVILWVRSLGTFAAIDESSVRLFAPTFDLKQSIIMFAEAGHLDRLLG